MLFCYVDAHQFFETPTFVKVTDTRTKSDFASFVDYMLAKHFPKVDYIQLVVDNLNSHFASSFYETMDKRKADRTLKQVKYIYSQHASWLNIA